EKAVFVRRFADERGIDLKESTAYADDAADLPLLSCVGRPVAVNPDLRLRVTARSHRWPILDLDETPSIYERALSGARTALDIGKEFAEKAYAEGEARWAEREEIVDRAKKILDSAGNAANNIAAKARDAARDAVQEAQKEQKKSNP